MRRALIVALMIQVVPGVAFAHDFWLEPEDFVVEAPGRLEVKAQVGHGADVGEWPADPARIIALRLVSDTGITDIQSELANRRSPGRFSFSLPEAGVHVLALESTGAVSVLTADAFNAYIEEEGLTPIADHRAAEGLMEADGREVYSRRAKAIIVSSSLDAGECDTKVLTPIGMTLEIVPLVLPACLKPGASLPVEVRYRGEPLTGATLHFVKLGEEEVGDTGQWVTGVQGRASIPYPGAGTWMLQSVWSSPLTGDPRGDYDTVFSSLSFSIPKVGL
jgi:uncharacterized GH25 family protein